MTSTKRTHAGYSAGARLLQASLAVLLVAMALSSGPVRAAEQVTIQYTTSVPHPPPTPPNGYYYPKNVHVVWAENSTGGFIKTIGRWANVRRNRLGVWFAKATTTDTDGVSGATQLDEITATATWDMTRKGGGIVPDGIYRIRMQLTWYDPSTPVYATTFTLNKNGIAATLTPPDAVDSNGYGFKNITITYSGRPVPKPDISLSPTPLNFNTQVSGSHTSLGFDINNPGLADLSVTSLSLSGTDKGVYALVAPPAVPFTVAPGGKQTINVQFSPLLQGTYNNASVTLMSNVVGKETMVETLNGGCVAPKIQLTAGTLTFPTTNAGSQNTLSFGINNQGSALLHVTGLTPVGLDKGAYGVTTPTLPLTIAPAGSQNVTVRFAPTSDQSYNHGLIAIGSDDPTQWVTTVSLSGQGYRNAGTISGAQPIPGPSRAVAMLNANTACVGQGATLAIFDVSTPSRPVRLGQVRLGAPIQKLLVNGSIVYAALGAHGVAAVNAGVPASPVMVTLQNTPGSACDLALAGQTLCVADGMGGLQIFSVAIASAPALLASVATRGAAVAIAAAGTMAYVVDEAVGLSIIDLNAPASPKTVGVYPAELGVTVGVANQKVYLATRMMQMHILDVSKPTTPTLNATVATSCTTCRMTVAGTKLYLAGGHAGMETYNIGVMPPTAYGIKPVNAEALDLAVQGSVAMVAGGSGGLRILSLAYANNPTEIGYDALAGGAGGVANVDMVGAEADGTGGFKLVYLNSAGMAKLYGIVSAIGEARAVTISGTTAYVAAGSAGLKIVDISNPSAPVVQGTFATSGYANSVAVQGTMVLVADGLKVYRVGIANPALPAALGQWPADGYAFGVAIDGNFGYVANGGNGLRVLDLSSSSGLTRVGGIPTGGVAYGVAAANGFAYVGAGKAGLQVFNVATPSAPTVVAAFDTPGTAMGVALRGNTVYLADGEAGMDAIDISRPNSPQLQSRTSMPLRAWSVADNGFRLLVGDNLGGPVYFMFKAGAAGWTQYQ